MRAETNPRWIRHFQGVASTPITIPVLNREELLQKAIKVYGRFILDNTPPEQVHEEEDSLCLDYILYQLAIYDRSIARSGKSLDILNERLIVEISRIYPWLEKSVRICLSCE